MTESVLSFVHTVASNIETFDALVAELAPDIPVRHTVQGDLLTQALDAGDMENYLTIIAEGLHLTASDSDVIVLAQASMSPALKLCEDIEVPILSSPRSGLAAAIDTYKSIFAG